MGSLLRTRKKLLEMERSPALFHFNFFAETDSAGYVAQFNSFFWRLILLTVHTAKVTFSPFPFPNHKTRKKLSKNECEKIE